MPDPENKEVNFEDLVNEIEASGDVDQAEELVEDAATEEEVAEEEVPVIEAAEVAEEDDDAKWAATQKTISQPAFLARLQREKKKRDELETRFKATQGELETARKSQPVSASDLDRFKNLDGVFRNLDAAAKEMPWVTDMLLALGRGLKPDWTKVQEGLAGYMASVPKGDPILYQQQQELREQLVEIQNERVSSQVVSHVQAEDLEITKILGPKNDPIASPWWEMLNQTAEAMFRSGKFKSIKEAPNRVQLAQRMKSGLLAYHQKQLKTQLPPKKLPSLATGNGGAGGGAVKKDKAPLDMHSPEWEAWFLAGTQP